MFALINVTSKSASSFEKVRKFLPKQLLNAEVVTKLDDKGYVRNLLKIECDDNNALEGLHDVNSKMGNDSIIFVTTCGVAVCSVKNVDTPRTLGFFTLLTKGQKVSTETYFMDGQRYTIGNQL